MTTKRLVLTVGLPRAGKSSWAKCQQVPVVNPDSVRLAMHGQAFVPEAEEMVWAVVRLMVKALFGAGHSTVILDATAINRASRDKWRSKDWDVNYRVFATPAFVCQSRAVRDGRDDLLPVIVRMAEAWQPLTEEEKRFEIEGGMGGPVPPIGGRPE